MAYSVRSDLYTPQYSRTYTGARALTVADAPAECKNLPAYMFVNAAAGQVLEYTDVEGTTNTQTFAAGYAGTWPGTAMTLTANTTCTVTVFWNPS